MMTDKHGLKSLLNQTITSEIYDNHFRKLIEVVVSATPSEFDSAIETFKERLRFLINTEAKLFAIVEKFDVDNEDA